MRIAVLSDIHDHIWNFKAALSAVQNTDALIFCGDICSPFTLVMLAKQYVKPVYTVFGNNDGDRFAMQQKAAAYPHVNLCGEFMIKELGDRKFFVNHYPEIALEAAKSGSYDVVCYGHNHEFSVQKINNTLLINPGTLLGFAPRKFTDCPASFVILDTETMQIERADIVLNDSERILSYSKVQIDSIS